MMLATKLLGTWRVPPAVVNDAAETDASTAVGGNVLTNDSGGTLYVSAVNGLPGNVGQVVAGSNGGDFVINADGSWTFDPSGDFDALSGSDTATTSVSYHANNGDAEAIATLVVTVSGVIETDHVLLLVQAPESGSSIVDTKGHTVTLSGDTTVVTTLGIPSIRFDGSGDIASIPYTSDLAWGAGDWTVEFLFHPNSVSSGTLFCDAPASGGYYALRVLLGGGNIYAFMYDSSDVEFLVNCGVLSANALHHFAVQRIGGNVLNFYKNGVFVTSRSITSGRSMKVMSAPFTFGAYYSVDYYDGHILAARKTNGTARYTADFTPPTWPLPVS